MGENNFRERNTDLEDIEKLLKTIICLLKKILDAVDEDEDECERRY